MTPDGWLWGTVATDVAVASYADGDALTVRQRQRLARLLASAKANSPFYGRLLEGFDCDHVHLNEIPVVHKTELMHRFDEWVTDPAIRLDELRRFVADRSRIAEPYLDSYLVWESSGSGGEPGIFVQDDLALAVFDALEAVRRPMLRPARRFFDPWGWGEQIAFVGATEGHFASTVSFERLRRLNPALAQRLRCISFMQPVAAIVGAIDAMAPSVIATYPSAAVMLAEERLHGRMRTAPREVWTGGENLCAAKRAYIQSAFHCALADNYGASEFLSLAFECEKGSLHLNSDWAILEAVDEHQRPVPRGETGATALLTNLANHLQPLIRYDLGDRVSLHARGCACGSRLPVIEVEGRCEDTLRIEGDGAAVQLLPLALSTAIEDGAGLFDFQLVQQGPRDLLMRTGLQGGEAELALRKAHRALSDFLRAQGVTGVQIECRAGEPGRAGRSGKVPRVVSAASTLAGP